MKRAILIALFATLPLTAAAQDTHASESGFQDQMVVEATEAGVAALPAACGGLFRAMWLLADEGSTNADIFNEKHVDAAMVGVSLLASANNTSGADEVANMQGHMADVSKVYLDWFTFNRSNQEFITDMIRENFTFCDGQLATWAASSGN